MVPQRFPRLPRPAIHLLAGSKVGLYLLTFTLDTVLYFEGERGHPFRILRAHKNRFGSTNESLPIGPELRFVLPLLCSLFFFSLFFLSALRPSPS
jgi:hypothetical protein